MEKDDNTMSDLLLKYYEGETSLEEEKVLEEYFLNHPDQHAEHAWFTGRHIFKREIPSITLASRTIADLENQNPIPSMRPWHIGIAATLVLALFGLALYSTFVHKPSEVLTIETGVSQQKITLADGSTITLNTNTTFKYPKTFDGDERVVWLKNGEAFFDVAKDPKRPFIVNTQDTRTKVLGTTFNIRTADSLHTEVTVITGAVSFNANTSNEKEQVLLQAGTAGTFNSREKRVKRFDEIRPNSIAWITHQLEFKDVSVEEVFKTLERYFTVIIQTTDNHILSCRFRGSFNNADLAEIFEVMSFSLDLTFSQEGKIYTVSGKGCKPE